MKSTAISELSDRELRDELCSYGVPVGPVTGTTRRTYERQLEKRRLMRRAGGDAPASKSPTRRSRTPTRRGKSSDNLTAKAMNTSSSMEHSTATTQTVRAEILTPPNLSPLGANYYDTPKLIHTDVDIRSGGTTSSSYVPIPLPEMRYASTIYDRTTYSPLMADKFQPSSNILSSSSFNRSNDRTTMDRVTTVGNDKNSFVDGNKHSIESNFTRIRRHSKSQSKAYEEQTDSDFDDHLESSRFINSASPVETKRSSDSSYFHNIMMKPWRNSQAVSSSSKIDYFCSNIADTRDGRLFNSSFIPKTILCCLAIFLIWTVVAYSFIAHPQLSSNTYDAVKGFMIGAFYFVYAYAILPVTVLVLAGGAGTIVYLLNQHRKKKQIEKSRKLFELIDKITDIIRDTNGEGYVAEPHVRDMLIPPSKRSLRSEEWRQWQEAVNFINAKESRVCTERRVIGGVECSVWRWIPPKKTGWQGNAFEGQKNLNVPVQALSNCLKIRGMFSSSNSLDECDVDALLREKIAPVRPIHLHVDKMSTDGVVFVRFPTLSDCKSAYVALHGTWFNGHLVSVKFLRNERYQERFPNAPTC